MPTPDPDNLNSPPVTGESHGIITTEEVWNEIGWPVDNPHAESHTTLESIRATRDRILRGYNDQALAAIQQSEDFERYSRITEQQTVSISQGSGAYSNVGVGEVPGGYLPFFFSEVVADDNTPLAATDDVHKKAHTSLSDWQDYFYELAGRDIHVLPKDIDSIEVLMAPQDEAIEMTLGEIVPEINQQIIEAARQALELRTTEAERIKQEALGETPST